jgi:hypothetical protein
LEGGRHQDKDCGKPASDNAFHTPNPNVTYPVEHPDFPA